MPQTPLETPGKYRLRANLSQAALAVKIGVDFFEVLLLVDVFEVQ
jgi:hypothetical protein